MSGRGDDISRWKPEPFNECSRLVAWCNLDRSWGPRGLRSLYRSQFLAARASARFGCAVVSNNVPVGLEDIVCFSAIDRRNRVRLG